MTRFQKVISGLILGFALLGVGIFMYGPKASQALQLYTPVYNYAYLSQNTGSVASGTVVSYGPGVLHTVTLDTEATGSIVTLYDSATPVITSPTTATGTILFGPSTTSTSTATGTYSATINGVVITSASEGSGTTANTVATAMATAITASSSQAGVTATSSNNIVTLTSLVNGSIGNFPIAVSSTQNGLSAGYALFPSTGSQVIAQITLPATLVDQGPITGIYDTAFKNGLVIQQTGNTSTVTVSWAQQ